MINFNNRKIVFVAGLHGNEQMPVKALQENRIPFIFGNPAAYEKNARFLEHDLNAAFGIESDALEAKRAREILSEINESDFVIDFHSTGSTPIPFAIVVDVKMIPLAAQTGLDKVVIMKYNIKEGHALINYRDGISIETGLHTKKESYEITLSVVENLKLGIAHRMEQYEVYEKITKPGNYINFEEHPDGFIPILANETAYNFYGLKARKI